MLTRKEMYSDIVAIKEFIRNLNNECNTTPEIWLKSITHTDLNVRVKTAVVTVLYTGHWNLGWYGPEFMMPATRDCLEQYPNVHKNINKTMKLKKLRASEDDKEWEGYVALFFDNFREKKTA